MAARLPFTRTTNKASVKMYAALFLILVIAAPPGLANPFLVGMGSWLQALYPSFRCISLFNARDYPLRSVTSEEGLTWHEMEARCRALGPGITLSSVDLNPRFPNMRPLCPDGTLVPIRTVSPYKSVKWYSGEEEDVEPPREPLSNLYPAFLWPEVQVLAANSKARFHCAVCQMAPRTNVVTQPLYPQHDNNDFKYGLELVSYDRFDNIDQLASEFTTQVLDDLADAFNISASSLRWQRAYLNEELRAVVHVYYDRKTGLDDPDEWFFYDHWNYENLKYGSVGHFEVTMIKKSTECISPRKQLKNTVRRSLFTGDIYTKYLRGVLHLNTSECYWDESIEGAVWSPPIEWEPIFEDCSLGLSAIADILSLSGRRLTLALKYIDFTVALGLEVMSREDYQFTSMRLLLQVQDLIASFHTRAYPATIGDTFLSHSTPLNLAKLYMVDKFTFDGPTMLSYTKYINVLLAEGQPTDPVIGMATTIADSDNNLAASAMQLSLTELSMPLPTAHIVVTVSEPIAFAAKRLQIGTYAAHLNLDGMPSPDTTLGSWMAMVQVTFKRNTSDDFNLASEFVDISFKRSFEGDLQKGKCAEWLFDAEEWNVDNCRIQKSLRDDMLVCRCKNMHHEGDMSTGSFLIYGYDASLSTFLSNHLSLVIVMVCVCTLSGLGIFSVIITAVSFPKWREDKGHKVFMQMILALSVNLLLGFVNSFTVIDTKSVGCVVLGAVKHYSFLAMFFWMLILSALQVRRITTIGGSKSTTHLILKVSAIGWGLPLVPIIILLSWDTRFYKSEVSNRGYCYPEDVAFQATVQGPAGIILGINLIIFCIIVNHIYGWVKFDNIMEVRKFTGNDRAEQLRRLRTSIFVFFLFGFTWVFHFLSEEGVINSEFLFEYLFLITASFHVFMLALFFIALDENTRKLWVDAFSKK